MHIKNCLIFLPVFLFAALQLSADEAEQKRFQKLNEHITQMAEKVLAEMPELEPEQQMSFLREFTGMQIKQIHTRQQMKKARDEQAGREKIREIRQNSMKARQEHMDAISGILNEEQFEAFKAALEKLAPKEGQGRGQGGGGLGRGQGGGNRGGGGGGQGGME